MGRRLRTEKQRCQTRMALPFAVQGFTSRGGGQFELGLVARLGQELQDFGTPLVGARFAATGSLRHFASSQAARGRMATRRVFTVASVTSF